MRKSKLGKSNRAFNSPLKVKEALEIAKSPSRLASTNEEADKTDQDSCAEKELILKQISELETKIQENNEQGYSEENYRRYLNLMHDYNDMKDLASAYMGHLATLKQCSVKTLYQQFGLDPDQQ